MEKCPYLIMLELTNSDLSLHKDSCYYCREIYLDENCVRCSNKDKDCSHCKP